MVEYLPAIHNRRYTIHLNKNHVNDTYYLLIVRDNFKNEIVDTMDWSINAIEQIQEKVYHMNAAILDDKLYLAYVNEYVYNA